MLARVPMHASFWLCTNENLRSIADVSKALEKASDDVFRYHVNRDKNDFEVWIRDVVKDKDLAREIARVKTRETLIRKITERVEALRGVAGRSDSGISKKKAKKVRRKAAKRNSAKSGMRNRAHHDLRKPARRKSRHPRRVARRSKARRHPAKRSRRR